jgi:hypothetical protein
MTVAELIEKLKQFPQNYEVVAGNYGEGDTIFNSATNALENIGVTKIRNPKYSLAVARIVDEKDGTTPAVHLW